VDIMELILIIPILLLSLSLHEYSHGKVSHLLGDPTPEMMGRLTLNPIAHLDLMGTLVLIITRRIGWAKPVPVNPRYYKNPRKGLMLVGLAGPAANMLLAILFSLILRLYLAFGNFTMLRISYGLTSFQQTIITFLYLAVMLNISLAVFNLLPVPPLDGSKILRGFLPHRFDRYLNQLEGMAGMLIIMLLAFTGILWRLISPIIYFVLNILI